MTGGSTQLRAYRIARRTASLEAAAATAGITITEAQLIDRDDAREPPAPECFKPIPAAGFAVTEGGEPMARGRKAQEQSAQEVPAPDYSLAVSIYRKDIKPAASKVGEFSQEMSTAYKDIKKRANIQPQAAKLAFKLDDMEESKRDDYLRSLNGLLKELKIYMPSDLVDAAQGSGAFGDAVVPSGERRRPQLATVPSNQPDHPADDSDLAGDDGEHLQAAE